MTLAELLRRSAEYARRSIEELTRALNPPARHGAPSFEPAYARRGSRPFRPKEHGGFGKRFFHRSCTFEARMRSRTHSIFWDQMGRRGSKFFGANFNERINERIRNHFHEHLHGEFHTRLHDRWHAHFHGRWHGRWHDHFHRHGGRHCHFHRRGPFLFRLVRKALRATYSMSCAFSRPMGRTYTGKTRPPSAMPNLIKRAASTQLLLHSNCNDSYHNRISVLCGNQVAPSHTPYEVLRHNMIGCSKPSKSDSALLRFEDKFRPLRAINMEIREKMRSLASFQQSFSEFLMPRAPLESKWPSPNRRDLNIGEPAERSAVENECVPFEDEAPNVEATSISAAVDFAIAPRISLPVVGELNENMVDSIRTAIESQIANLRAVLADVDRISELGELPVSLEQNGTVLRVHLPNCDAERANVLVDDKEVTRGRTVEVIAPRINIPGSETMSSSASSEFDMMSDAVSSEVSDEVWYHVRNDTPDLTTMDSSQSHSSPSLVTLG